MQYERKMVRLYQGKYAVDNLGGIINLDNGAKIPVTIRTSNFEFKEPIVIIGRRGSKKLFDVMGEVYPEFREQIELYRLDAKKAPVTYAHKISKGEIDLIDYKHGS